jgi:hypothetical protein
LKTILKETNSKLGKHTTPTLESPTYIAVVVHHHVEADGTDIFRNEATAIELTSSISAKVSRNPEFDPLENDFEIDIQSWECSTPTVQSRTDLRVAVIRRTVVGAPG